MGITDFTQTNLGPISRFEAVAKIGKISEGADLAIIESMKSLYPIPAPFTGGILEISHKPSKYPSILNVVPYEIWIAKLKVNEQGIEIKRFMDHKQVEEWQNQPETKAEIAHPPAPEIVLEKSEQFEKHVADNVKKWVDKVIRITDTTCCGVSVVVTKKKYIRPEDKIIGYVLGIGMYAPPRIAAKVKDKITRVTVEIKEGFFGEFFHFEFFPPQNL
jgi:glycine cleavage system H lipoate-binding protein